LEKEKWLVQVRMETLANTDDVPVIKTALPIKTVPPSPQPSIEKDADPQKKVIKVFLSKILASLSVMKDPSFFKDGVGSSTIGDLLQQTAAEIEKKKANDKKIEEAFSAALRGVETFSEIYVLPSHFPFLADLQDSRGRRICLTTNKDIQKLHCVRSGALE
jgi:hypothetical protein